MSITQITEDIKKAITDNLPMAAGELLKKRLEQADLDSAELVRQKKEFTKLTQDNLTLTNRVIELDSKLAAHSALDKREAELNKRAHDLDLEILNVKLSEANSSKEFTKQVALGLVRNTEYRSSVFDSVSGKSVMSNGYLTNLPTESRSTNSSNSAD